MFRMLKSWCRPLPTPVALALIALLPRSAYLNRGFTVWFHLLSLVYFLSRSPFVAAVLVLQGTGICLGWYSAIIYDFFAEGTFCHTLYRNMPQDMVSQIVREGANGEPYAMLTTPASWATRAAAHLLDALGHPGLLCLAWRAHRRHGGTEVPTWPAIVVAWHLSRAWSLVHSYHNTGAPALWYYGHDVYLMTNLDCYTVAYVAEGVCFAGAIFCRWHWDRSSSSPASAVPASWPSGMDLTTKEAGDKEPTLVHSVSGTSASSMVSPYGSTRFPAGHL